MLHRVGTRERVAALLDRTGALAGLMRVRRFVPVPTLAIVTYHHITEQDGRYAFDPDVADATPAQFRRQMETLARHCTVVGVDDVIAAIEGKALPSNPVLITFDDGYRSCHDTALPILRAVGVPATFFIATAFTTERRIYWWERIALLLSSTKLDHATLSYPHPIAVHVRAPGMRRALTDIVKDTASLDLERFLTELTTALEVPWSREIEARHASELIMTWDQIRAVAAAGMDIGSHTRTHRVLQTLDEAALDDELGGSKADLERELGRPTLAVAYPVGRTIAEVPKIRQAIDRAGYRIGMSNASGVNRMWPQVLRGMLPVDRFDIRRLSTDRTMSDAMFFTQVALPGLSYISKFNR